MLPVVVIGADSSVREVFETWDREIQETGLVLFYDNVEDAAFGLDHVARDDEGRWRLTVIYGPEAFGPIVTAQRGTLPHTGWTGVAASNIREDQARPRRMRDRRVEGEPAQTMIFEAMAKLGAQFVIDTAKVSGDDSLAKLANLLESRPTP